MIRRTLSRLWASMSLFGRLPLYRIWKVDADAYRYATHYWPLAGAFYALLSGSIGVYVLFAFLPLEIATALLMTVSLFLSGAFHEDGLADFFDGFGGGTNRERILMIMKDSHIGTYGVLALIMYFILTFSSLQVWMGAMLHVSREMCLLMFVMTAFWARTLSCLLPAVLPYARNEESAKVGFTYAPWRGRNYLSLVLCGVVFILAGLLVLDMPLLHMCLWTLLPLGLVLFLMGMMRRGIGGYTGDCCGAAVLMAELIQNIILASLLSASQAVS